MQNRNIQRIWERLFYVNYNNFPLDAGSTKLLSSNIIDDMFRYQTTEAKYLFIMYTFHFSH